MLRTILSLGILLMATSIPQMFYGQDRSHGRSMVITDRGIVGTSHYLASQAGAQILAKGGSAMDAAIAANAVLGVTEPMMNGIGGDLFLIYWDAKSGKLYGLNASGWAPKDLTIDFLARQGITAMPHDGIHSVTVPGTVEGWSQAHHRFGKLPWKDLFSAAIYYGERGYAVPEIIQEYWAEEEAKMQKTDEARRVFLPGGKPPELGARFSNPDIAKALKLIASQGKDAFYKGEIAQAIVQTSSAFGGTMQLSDLAEFSAEWVEPVSSEYRGWTIYELPPNGQGMAALEMLNIMGNFEPDKAGPQGTVELHKKIEAMKLAYADLYRYNADTRFAKVPVRGLISKEYGAQRASLIQPDKANCDPGAGSPSMSDTTYLAAVDKEGNIASLIQSNYSGFGSGIVVRGMGFALQNRGGLFSLDPKHPNALLPRKRPFHTIIPAFMERGDVHIGFGIMGGANQPLAHAQFVSNLVDYGMNIQAAMEAPRFTVAGGNVSCDILIESRVKPDVLQALRGKGHNLMVRKEYTARMGRGQAVLHNSRTGMNYGASDPRADGIAEPEPPEIH
ncbi:MAG TPA: gamma-glutamyltransferase [Candidatus Angelobacter sp.]|nr:gamma-glutamyltransferase [Candidatus Angelobacter sp.]